MEFKDMTHDKDSSEDVWTRLYDKIYANNFSGLFDFSKKSDSETSKNCKRLYIKINAQTHPELSDKYPKFKIAGDCDFNFNDKKIELFENILKEKDRPVLTKCHSFHHELCNFSFMPITGGMNNTKGLLRCASLLHTERKPYDRLDMFIAELSNYYSNEATRIFSTCNKEALKWYLDLFEDIYDYCNVIYLIDDKSFVENLITSGKEPIVNRGKAIRYMELALQYWDIKSKALKKLGVN